MTSSNLRIGVIAGSIRDNRLGGRVFEWVAGEAEKVDGWKVERLDLKELDLPLYHDALQPAEMKGDYPDLAVKDWSKKIAGLDGFIIVTAEYNHGLPAPLKNALDWLYPEWNDKAAALVGYSSGNGGGIRAVEQLRLTLAHLGVATCQQVTTIARAQDHFDETGTPAGSVFDGSLARELGQLDKWARALKTTR
jgi:NAD(P)H-dependent FMN reductase